METEIILGGSKWTRILPEWQLRVSLQDGR